MTALVLGPLLRHVGERTATVWVETDRPCEVSVLDATARTFTVHGHHYALVEIEGLEPGSANPYEVRLDGELVWPVEGTLFPQSTIRTAGAGERLRVSFGSCRRSPDTQQKHGLDALAAFAYRLAGAGTADGEGVDPPDLLLMIGDQVYADELGDEIRSYILSRRGPDTAPQGELADFEEYTYLYRLAWGEDRAVRWLLSTVPTFTIFDDHDVRDDWNTSYIWRQQMWAKPWWRKRIVGGLGSYWIYQHLGNLSPRERAADAVYTAVRQASADGGDAGKILDEFAERADKEPAHSRWSYAHDVNGTRLIMVDSRCARLLTADRRAMLDDTELAWLDEQCQGDRDHVLIASSLPYLLPSAIHYAESWNEAVAGGAWGARMARLGEQVRQGADLEHWAAFAKSFNEVAEDVLAVGNGERGRPPASVTFLSGDVHYSYLARVTSPHTRTPIAQVVCSPLRNPLIGKFRWANIFACKPTGSTTFFRGLAKLARVPRPPLRWKLTHGPWFDNAIATVEIDGRTARVRWESPATETSLRQIALVELTK